VFRDLVEREENFNCDVSDAFLIRFLRAKKYDYEAAFKMLQRYLGIRARRKGGCLKNSLIFPSAFRIRSNPLHLRLGDPVESVAS